jgi:phage terminase small subunit
VSRQRKDDALKAQQGTLQAQRVETSYAFGAKGTGTCQPPDWLSPPAIQVWAATEPAMRAARLATDLDSGTLGRYCELMAMFITEKRRRKNRNPDLILKLNSQIQRISVELGLSPKARAGITVAPEEEADQLERLVG